MRIFVTGASGFVGGAAAKALQGDHEILAMARSPRSEERIRALGVEPIPCDLSNVTAEHLAGCQALIHAAAYVEQWGTRQQFWQANVEGTSRLLEAAKSAGVSKFIHIGTEAALFHGQDMDNIDETYPYPTRTPFLYSETKAEAERRVLAANDAKKGFRTISLRPRLIWGPGDQTIVPVITTMVEKGQYMWIDGGRITTSTTHIANLVHAITLALNKDQGGEAYFITDGEDQPFRDFITKLMAAHGITLPNKSIPGWLARSLAIAVESVWKTLNLKSDPPLTRFAANIMSRNCTLRIEKAQRYLEYQPPVAVEQGLAILAEESKS